MNFHKLAAVKDRLRRGAYDTPEIIEAVDEAFSEAMIECLSADLVGSMERNSVTEDHPEGGGMDSGIGD